MLEAVDGAIGRARERPGPGRLGFAGLAGGATAVSSFIATQVLLVIVNWPDLSFWGFAIFVSVIVAAIAGLASLAGDILVWVVGARLLPTGVRVVAVCGTHLAVAVGAQVAYALSLSTPVLENPVIALVVLVPAMLGATVAGIAVWRRRPEGPFAARKPRQETEWVARPF